MKVSSPVGEFPFDADRLRIEGTRVALEGRMGAWPARVEMGPADALRIARLALPRIAAPALGLVLVSSLVGRRRRRRVGR
jgi:hypothetical protein